MTNTSTQQNGTGSPSSGTVAADIDADMQPPSDIDIDVLDATDSEGPESPEDLNVDFDGGLMSEEPDFDEDFAPDEAEIAVASASKAQVVTSQDSTRSKRTAADADDLLESPQKPAHPEGANKRVKLEHSERTPAAVDAVPMELWTEIFAYLQPETLGKLRRVCRNFYKALVNENVWRRSRKIHAGDMPKPVFGLREWQMWELWKGAGCMLCDRYDGLPKGSGGVRIYWPFRVRCCPECLQENTTKEMVLMKANPLPINQDEIRLLIPALPYGILDAGQNWNGNPNSYVANAGMSKIYWNDDILELKERYDQAKEMSAAEEWLKGLESEGHSYKADADRMDRWETRVMTGSNIPRKGGSTTSSQPQPIVSLGNSYGHSSWEIHQQARNPPPPLQQPPNFPHHPAFHQNTRHERTASEVAEIKAQRQNEIELRCLQLGPPMHANVLIHCPAFQAAIKIAQPFNDQGWQLLLPKLNAERPAAEKAAKHHQEQQERLQRQQEERRMLESKEKEEWVRRERIWEESQVPVREMLGKIVDAEIKAFGDGKIDKLSAPRFAVAVLVSTRAEYYKQGGIPELPKADEEKPEVRRLVLENMKWVFDTKLKPLTEPWRKDLFLCRGCGDTVPKLYGFEGVIQHYAAKHTSEMSLGNVVVHWRSEWPEEPPFADPTVAKKLPPQNPNRTAPGNHGQSFYGRGQQPPSMQQGYGGPPSYGNQHRMPPPPPHSHGPYDYQNGSQHYGAPPPHGRDPHHAHHHVPPTPPPHQQHMPHQPPAPYYGSQAYPPPPSAQQPEYGHTYPPTSQPAYPPYSSNTYTAAPSQPPYYAAAQNPPPAPAPYDAYGQPPPARYSTDPSPHAAAYPPAIPPGPPPAPAARQVQPNNSKQFNSIKPSNTKNSAPSPPSSAPSKSSQPEPVKKDDARHGEMLDFVSTVSLPEWNILSDVRDLQNSVKVTVLITKVYDAFKAKFNSMLTVQLYHEALREKENMKFLRGVSDLNCGACSGTMANRSFTLPLLLQHFESVHLFRPAAANRDGRQQQKQVDWLVDMNKLPAQEELRKLRERQGFDPEKLKVISKLFPGVFEAPRPVEASSSATKSNGSKKASSKKETLIINTQVSTPESNGSTSTLKSGAGEPPGSAPKTASKESMTAAELFLRDFMGDSEGEGKVVSADVGRQRAGSQSNKASARASPSGRATGSNNQSQERRPADASSRSKGASQDNHASTSTTTTSFRSAAAAAGGSASSHRHGASLDMDSSRRGGGGNDAPPLDFRRTNSLDESRRYPGPGRRRSISPRRDPPPRNAAPRDDYSRRSTPSRPNFPGPPGRDDDRRYHYDTPPRRVRSPSPIGSAGRYDDRMPPGPALYRDYPPEHYPPHHEYDRDPYYDRHYDRDAPPYRDEPHGDSYYYGRRDGRFDGGGGGGVPYPPPPPPPPRGYYDEPPYDPRGRGRPPPMDFRDRSPLPDYRRPPSPGGYPPPPPRRRNTRSVSPPYRGNDRGGGGPSRDPYYDDRDARERGNGNGPPYGGGYRGPPPPPPPSSSAQGSMDDYNRRGGRDERYYPPRGW